MKKAFTIIELMLYMGIFSILIAVLSGMFVSIMELQLSTHSNSEVTQAQNYIFSRLQYDLYRTQSITVPALPGNSGSVLTLSIGGQPYTYQISGNNLVLNSYILNSPDVSITDFIVTSLGTAGKPNVRINLTVQSNVTPLNKSPESVTLTQSFTLK